MKSQIFIMLRILAGSCAGFTAQPGVSAAGGGVGRTASISPNFRLLDAPQVIVQPQSNQPVLVGTTTTLTVVVASTDVLTYAWSGSFEDTLGNTLTGGIPGASGIMTRRADGTEIATYTAGPQNYIYYNYRVTISGPTGTVTSVPVNVNLVTPLGNPVKASPVFDQGPADVSFNYGGSATLTAAVYSVFPLRYVWQKNGVFLKDAVSPTLVVSSPGIYTLSAETDYGFINKSAAVTLANRMAAISSRALVGTADNIAIAGFNISSYGTATKRVLLRAVGPSLVPLGVSGILARPQLAVYDANAKLVATNSGWNNSAAIAAAGVSVGDFPLLVDSADSALLLDLAPGAYTAQVSGIGGTTGVALVEVYEPIADDGHFTGLAARASVSTGGNILIGGFALGGSQPSQLVIRASGPALAQFGLGGFLAQPVLTIYNSSGQVVATNMGWGTNADPAKISSAAATVGLFAYQANSADSALVLTLPPGAYTAQVAGANNSIGTALLEIYQIPQTGP